MRKKCPVGLPYEKINEFGYGSHTHKVSYVSATQPVSPARIRIYNTHSYIHLLYDLIDVD